MTLSYLLQGGEGKERLNWLFFRPRQECCIILLIGIPGISSYFLLFNGTWIKKKRNKFLDRRRVAKNGAKNVDESSSFWQRTRKEILWREKIFLRRTWTEFLVIKPTSLRNNRHLTYVMFRFSRMPMMKTFYAWSENESLSTPIRSGYRTMIGNKGKPKMSKWIFFSFSFAGEIPFLSRLCRHMNKLRNSFRFGLTFERCGHFLLSRAHLIED